MKSTSSRHARWVAALAFSVTTLAAAPSSAQQGETEFASWRVPGWSVTPGLSMGLTRDTNVALMDSTESGTAEADSMYDVEPFGSLEFFGPRTEFSAGYRGFMRRYTRIDELNGFDQRFSARFRHDATKRLAVFLNDSFSDVPTTDEVELSGIPFVRTGARTNNLAGGIEARLNKFTDLSARYESTWVAFDNQETALRGGVVNGVATNLVRRLTPRLSVGGEYSLRFANLNEGTRALNFQDAGGTIAYQAGPHTLLSGAAGISHLSDELFDSTRTAPYFRLRLAHDLNTATIGTSYERTFVPAFGFGGANESQELMGFVHMPIPSNRTYVQGSVAWRRSVGWMSDLDLDTVLVRSTVGYALARWFRLEGSYSYSLQNSKMTGGEVDRHRLGAQVVISQPMRIH